MITKIITSILMNFHGANSDIPYVKKSDLPSEFSEEALKTINDFIMKTRDLNYELGMFFDYRTGEILKESEGGFDDVSLEFESDEFIEKHVASIHNHHKDLISPPSGKNFGILEREFEDYELIAGYNEFWILEAKGTNKSLMEDIKVYSGLLYDSLNLISSRFYPKVKQGDIVEKEYGEQISRYINNKNIKNLKLTKVRYYHVRI